jgi:hypothetical protein
MTAKIIPIRPIAAPLCFDCTHGYCGSAGIICEITMTHVFDERTAQSCEAFEKEPTCA